MTTSTDSIGRRRYGGGGKRTRFDILADVAAAAADRRVSEVKKRDSKLLRRSLLRKPGENPPPIKPEIKRRQPVPVAVGVSVSVPIRQHPPPAAIPIPSSTVSPAYETPRFVLPSPIQIYVSPREKEELHESKRARVLASVKGVSVLTPPPAAFSPVPRNPSPALSFPSTAPKSPRVRPRLSALLPVDPQEELDLPLSLKARVSAAVGGEQVCSMESKFTLVVKKELTRSDLKPDQCRISIPGLQIEKKFLESLTPHERTAFRTGGNIKLAFFLDPDFHVAGEECSFGKWKMTKSEFYKVNGKGWRSVLDRVEKGMLRMNAGDKIEIWSFRTVNSGELCFLLVNANEMVAEEGEEAAAMGRRMTEHRSPMESYSSSNNNISTLTHQEEVEEDRSVVDLSLRL